MFLYELVMLLRPFELQTEPPEYLVRKKQRPQIPESTKVMIDLYAYETLHLVIFIYMNYVYL